jgi:hypothetical protein
MRNLPWCSQPRVDNNWRLRSMPRMKPVPDYKSHATSSSRMNQSSLIGAAEILDWLNLESKTLTVSTAE